MSVAASGLSRSTGRPRGADDAGDGEFERWLLRSYYASGDLALREELVERFLPLARDLAGRYAYMEESFDDLLQVAYMGLIKAIDRFEPARGVKFTSYAAPTILGELKRYFRDKGWALHLPRSLQERTLQLTRETERLSKQCGRSPTVAQLADATGFSVEEVIEAQEAASAYRAASLDVPVQTEDTAAPLVELIGRDDRHFEMIEDRVELAAAWRQLPPLERDVVKLRLVDGLTQREIGERVGYSQMQISRVLRRALEALETS